MNVYRVAKGVNPDEFALMIRRSGYGAWVETDAGSAVYLITDANISSKNYRYIGKR